MPAAYICNSYIDRQLNELIRQKEKLLKQIASLSQQLEEVEKQIMSLFPRREAIIVDYEEWVRQRSIELFGEVKKLYPIRHVAQILGRGKSTIHRRGEEGHVKTVAGLIPFDEVVKLAAFYDSFRR